MVSGSAMLDWLIIGGGVHGTHLSLHLTRVRRVPREKLRVLDPFDAPLARWDACCKNAGMGFLRSPVVHQIDLPAWSLVHFSDSKEGKKYKSFIDPFQRPGMPLFREHSRFVVNKYNLNELRMKGKAQSISRCDGGFRIETDDGSIETRKVLFALSAGDMPRWPVWGRELKAEGAPIDHVFAIDFDREKVAPFEHAVVVGGGITGAQLAMALASAGAAHKRERERAGEPSKAGLVTLLSPHEPRVRRFDSNAGWMGPLNMGRFLQEPCMQERRAIIRKARHRGTMPAEVRGQLLRAVQLSKLNLKLGTVSHAARTNGGLALHCEDGSVLQSDRVVLATGFETHRPGGSLVDRAITELGLPVANCGFPLVDSELCWQSGIYVTGALAELEIGPAAKNIVGARLAAERLKA